MDDARIKEVFSDEVFVKNLFELETPEEAQAELKDKGFEFSIDEVLVLREMLVKALEKARENGGELSIEDMDDVAGGVLNVMIPAATAQVIAGVVNVAAKSLAVVIPATAAGVAAFFTRGRW